MGRYNLRMRAAGVAGGVVGGLSAHFTALPIENGAAENVLIGRVTVPGWLGSIVVTLNSTLGGLIKVAGTNGIFTGAVATNGQGTLAIAGRVELVGAGVFLAFSDTGVIISPAFTAMPFGTANFGTWPTTVPADLGITTQGTAADFGYTTTPDGMWTTPMFDRATGTYYVGLRAVKGATIPDIRAGRWDGIKEVWFGGANPASWLVVTSKSNHPVYGNECFICPINTADAPSSGLFEIRAIIVPWVGEPYVMQGLPNPKTQSTNGFARTNYLKTRWSLQLNIDKTGTALPHGEVYLNTNTGSDSNDGLALGTPVLTYETAIAKLKAQHAAQGFSGTDAGGGKIYLTGLNQFYGTAVEEAPIPCATLPLIVTRAPGLTAAQVSITTSNEWGLKAEKGVLLGVPKTCKLNNYATSDSAASNYMSFRFHDVDHNGGPALQANGDTDGAPFCVVGNGFNECFNVNIVNCRSANLTRFTHIHNTVVDNHAQGEDVCNNPKGVVGFRGKNFLDDSSVSNHLDLIQFLNGRERVIIEDLVANESAVSQLVIFSTPTALSPYRQIHFIRPRLNNAPYTGNAFIISGKHPYTDVNVYDPQISGGYDVWPLATLSNRVRYVFETGSFWPSALTATKYRFGNSIITPDTLTEPNVNAPTADHFTTTYGDSLLDYINADELGTIDVVENTANIIQVLNSDIGVGSWLPAAGKGVPTFNANGIRTGVATVEFNGDNSTASSGAELFKGAPGVTIANQPVERWLIVNQQELAAQTTSRFVAVYGGTDANSRAIIRAVTGGVNKLRWQIGVGSGTVSLEAPGDFSGVCIVHVYYNPTDQIYGVGLWNAANPTYGEDNYTRGTVVGTVNTSQTRTAVGGGVSTSGGSQGSYWDGGINKSAVLTRNTTEAEREATLTFLRTPAGF